MNATLIPGDGLPPNKTTLILLLFKFQTRAEVVVVFFFFFFFNKLREFNNYDCVWMMETAWKLVSI